MPAAGVKGARVKPVATSPTQFSCSTTTTSTSTTTSTAPSRRVCHLGAVFLLAVAMSCLLLGLQLNAMLMPGDAWAQENAQQHQQRKVHRSPFALSTLSYPMVTREMMKVATKEVMDFSSGLSNPERAERIAKRKQLKAELEERQASILEWQSKLDLAPNQRAQLAEDKMQLERDKAIMLNDQKVEAVLSHYNEDLAWIDVARKRHHPHVRYTVYSKAQPQTRPRNTFHLKNVGRESHTYLLHIVRNYEKLAEWTVFSQAAKPGFGFTFKDSSSGHMCSGVTWEHFVSYYSDRDWFAAYTYATRFPEISNSERLDKIFRNDSATGDACPVHGRQGWGKWWFADNHPLKRSTIAQKAGKAMIHPVDFYNAFVSKKRNFSSFVLAYAQGGRFAVSRSRIHMRPRSFYVDLLNVLSKSISPIEGYYMEAMWFDVFHPDRLQAEHGPVCALPHCDERKGRTCAVPHGDMFTDAKVRWERASLPRGSRTQS